MSQLNVNTLNNAADSGSDISVSNLGSSQCKVWLNYDGTANTITDDFNVTSVTDNSTGNFTINFTNALADANYVFSGSGKYQVNDNHVMCIGEYYTGTTKTTSLLKIVVGTSGATGATGSRVDCENISVIIFSS